MYFSVTLHQSRMRTSQISLFSDSLVDSDWNIDELANLLNSPDYVDDEKENAAPLSLLDSSIKIHCSTEYQALV